jgi:hypothetical protein
VVRKFLNRVAGFVEPANFGRRSLQKGGNNETVHCAPNSNIVIFYKFVKFKFLFLFYKNLKNYLTEKLQVVIIRFWKARSFLCQGSNLWRFL